MSGGSEFLFLTNEKSEMRDFHLLQTQVHLKRGFVGRRNRISDSNSSDSGGMSTFNSSLRVSVAIFLFWFIDA